MFTSINNLFKKSYAQLANFATNYQPPTKDFAETCYESFSDVPYIPFDDVSAEQTVINQITPEAPARSTHKSSLHPNNLSTQSVACASGFTGIISKYTDERLARINVSHDPKFRAEVKQVTEAAQQLSTAKRMFGRGYALTVISSLIKYGAVVQLANKSQQALEDYVDEDSARALGYALPAAVVAFISSPLTAFKNELFTTMLSRQQIWDNILKNRRVLGIAAIYLTWRDLIFWPCYVTPLHKAEMYLIKDHHHDGISVLTSAILSGFFGTLASVPTNPIQVIMINRMKNPDQTALQFLKYLHKLYGTDMIKLGLYPEFKLVAARMFAVSLAFILGVKGYAVVENYVSHKFNESLVKFRP